MSRPFTRGKNKRLRPQDNVDDHSQILRKIHASGEVSSDCINQLFMIWKPICQGCRVNCKDNPNCFCGLIPPPNGVRKFGLWQRMSEIIQAIGPPPCPALRTSGDFPAGLTNLGATCYANSILQCLYMNRSLRYGVFSVEPDLLQQQPVLHQLARLFAQLYASKISVVDSAPFIETLELNNGVQQDSHEFLTLLLSLLERCLTQSKVSEARTIVQDLFRGSVSNVTICSRCQKNSEASSKLEDFYELELNIKGLKTLDDSLDEYLSVEQLNGDNQYFCESCQQRVDASRSIMLRNLPKVLNFQLKRCIFIPKTTKKKKITSSFSFPGVLDMKKRLSEAPSSGLIYDLSAILLHKGTTVNSGHYVAHIKDEKTGIWWEFDDELVTKLSTHPFEVVSSNSGCKDNKTEGISSASGVDCSQVTEKEDVKCPGSMGEFGVNTIMYSSSDAYMLMYTLRCERIRENFFIENDCLPHHLTEDIKVFNAAYVDMCEQYESRKEKEVLHITERRQEVRSILIKAPVQSNGQSYYWVATDWLRQWSDSINPPMLDNTPILCVHGKVPASKIVSMKRLSSEAWSTLLDKYNGGPTLTNDDCCTACLHDGAQSIISADSFRDKRMLMRNLSGLVLSGQSADGKYFISKSWLQQWVRRKNHDAPSEADAGPTASITCPHGQLLPEKAPGAKRLLVPENLWHFFYEIAMTVKHDETTGCIAFPLDADQCLQCNDELSEVASLEDSERLLKMKQRQTHEKLSAGKKISLSLQTKYYLVPTSWLARWRTYVNSNGKSTVEKPELMDAIMNTLKCEKHLLLAERPPDVEYKRGVILQKGSTIDVLTIIPESDWNGFCDDWGGEKESGISATIDSVICAESGLSSEEIMQKEALDCQAEDTGIDLAAKLILKTIPEVCKECVAEKETHELMEKLNYSDQIIFVTLIHGKEAPQSFLNASESYLDSDRRSSKRSRKTRDSNTITLNVSGSTSIYLLKMMIWEALGVVKENQILRKGVRVIDCESATLADCSIFPGDKLWVQDSEIYNNRDIADELGEQRLNAYTLEEGFRGTILTADSPPQCV